MTVASSGLAYPYGWIVLTMNATVRNKRHGANMMMHDATIIMLCERKGNPVIEVRAGNPAIEVRAGGFSYVTITRI